MSNLVANSTVKFLPYFHLLGHCAAPLRSILHSNLFCTYQNNKLIHQLPGSFLNKVINYCLLIDIFVNQFTFIELEVNSPITTGYSVNKRISYSTL